MTNRTPSRRGTVAGWSAASCRRNTAFLRSVDETALTGAPVTLTVTLASCPQTHQRWEALRRAYVERLRRAGLLRLHWVTEWQRRGVPHLHGMAYFGPDEPVTTAQAWLDVMRDVPLGAAWLELAAEFGARPEGQHFAPVRDAVGWLQYLAKHASRGVAHYQRNPANVPAEWRGRTGRVWGHIGDWPIRPPARVELGRGTMFRLRRLARAWRIAKWRELGDVAQVKRSRRMLSHPDRAVSEVRGISEWIPERTVAAMLDYLHAGELEDAARALHGATEAELAAYRRFASE